MSNIYFDKLCPDHDRRRSLYDGDIFVYSPAPATVRLCALAKQMITEAFAPHDPQTIDRFLSMEECARVLSSLKPAFIHHPECKRLLPEIICSIGADPNAIYFDVPRLRSAYPETYLTSGIAYAFHPHRDTWYSAPMCQINWWLPIFDIAPENCMAFYPKYFHCPIKNTSEAYNYAEWNKKSRVEAAVAHLGAANIDSRCTGTTMQDYLRCSDLSHLPDPLIASYEREIRHPQA